jgi:hypothetical protein
MAIYQLRFVNRILSHDLQDRINISLKFLGHKHVNRCQLG